MLLSDVCRRVLPCEGLWIDPSTGEMLYNGEEILPKFTFKECTEEMKSTVSKIEPTPMNVIPQIKRLHFNGPATVIIWEDDTKSIVKAMPDTDPNPYFGFCAAVAQKVFGSNCAVKRTIKQLSGIDVNRDPEPEEEYCESTEEIFKKVLEEIEAIVKRNI